MKVIGGSTIREQTNGQTDRGYQVHYLPHNINITLDLKFPQFFGKCFLQKMPNKQLNEKPINHVKLSIRLSTYTVWILYTVTHLLLELTVWYLSGNSRLTAASTREKEAPSHSRLHTAVSWVINCLCDIYLETAVWRPPPHGCLAVYRTTASQPPGGFKNTYPWTAVSQLFPNSRSYLAGGTILAM